MNNTKKWNKDEIVYWVVMMVPFLISFMFYSRLPERVPTHWGFDNQVNGYSSKIIAAFGIPAFMLFLAVLLPVVMRMDPRQSNIEKSAKMLKLCRWIIAVIAVMVQLMIILNGAGVQIPVSVITKAMMGTIFIFVGNYLPKCRQNYSMGLRFSWTLADEEIWNKTHRMAGFIWIIGGFLLILLSFVKEGILSFSIMGFLVLCPALYSYRLYRQKAK